MPLIRYDLGDIGIRINEKCTCGRALPLMKSIHGRSDDIITLPSGKIITSIGTFAPIIEEEPNVIEFLVTQENYDLITVKLVLREGNGEQESANIKHGIEELTSNEATIIVEIANRIERSEDKLRRIISKVPVKF